MRLPCSLALWVSTVCERVVPDADAHLRLMEAGQIEGEGWGSCNTVALTTLAASRAIQGTEERARARLAANSMTEAAMTEKHAGVGGK